MRVIFAVLTFWGGLYFFSVNPLIFGLLVLAGYFMHKYPLWDATTRANTRRW